MRKSYIVGISLFVIAAFFSLSLLLVLFDFGGMDTAHNSIFFGFGKFFTNAYGACAIFIPIYLIFAASQCFFSRWHIRTGILLLGSVLPFFTLVAIEKLCRLFARNESGLIGAKIFVTILIGVLVLALEFLVLSILGDFIERKLLSRNLDENSQRPYDIEEDAVVVPVYSSNSEIKVVEQEDEEKVETPVQPVNSFAEKETHNSPLFIGKLLKDSIHSHDVEAEPVSFENLANEVDAESKNLISQENSKENPFAHIFDEAEKNDAKRIEELKKQQEEKERERELKEKFNQTSEPILNPVDEIVFDDPFAEPEKEPEVEEVEISEEETFVEDLTEPEIETVDSESEIEFIDEKTLDEEDEFENLELDEDTIQERELVDELPEDDLVSEEEISEEESADEEIATEEIASEDIAEDEFDVEDVEDAAEVEVNNFAGNIEENDGISIDFDAPVETPTEEIGNLVFEDVEIDDIHEPTYVRDGTKSLSSDSIFELDTVPEVRVDFAKATVINDEGKSFAIETEVEKEDRNFQEKSAALTENAVSVKTTSEPDNIDFDFDEKTSEKTTEDVISNYSDSEIDIDFDEESAETPADNFASNDDEIDIDFDSEPVNEEEKVTHTIEFEPDEIAEIDDQLEAESSLAETIDTDEIQFEDDEDESDEEDDDELDDDFAEDEIDENESHEEESGSSVQNEAEIQNELQDESYDSELPVQVSEPKKRLSYDEDPIRRRWSAYSIPADLLTTYPNNEYWIIDDDTRESAVKLKNTFKEFKIDVEITGITKGPVVTMFELLPAPGVKLSKIVALQDNIALDLAASSVRIVAPIPGKHAVGIEVPNKERSIVGFREIVEQKLPAFEKMAIPVILGKDISGEPRMMDLAKTPHLLIAGSTGAGKSVCVNTMLLSILYNRSPAQVRLVLVDPKVVEMKLYNDIPHLLTPVITEPKRALQALQYCLCEMERRYALLAGMKVRDIISYNAKVEAEHIATEKLPYIVVVIDEFADLMLATGKELETVIARLAAKSRAIGIHLVLATQRPSTDVITGIIKANLPSRIAFMVASQMDSRVILDKSGAENLLGKGDMLYLGATDPFPVRIQGPFVSDDEVERTVDFVKTYGEPDYIDDEIFVDDDDDVSDDDGLFKEDGADPLYDEALQIVIQAGKASASYIQRRLSIGYNRAARLVEEMEARGIVGPANGSKPREIIHLP